MGRAWCFKTIERDGQIELLECSRARHDGWSDAMAIRDVGDARAYRCNATGDIVWTREGSLVEVIDALMNLPAPDAPGAPRLVIGPGPSLWKP
jgi:hypothetical protein